ncbi:40S ribosomal protein S27 [Hordeum vulgare]|nr:40S ribosomal protein S27 [Hordeum vulgare]
MAVAASFWWTCVLGLHLCGDICSSADADLGRYGFLPQRLSLAGVLDLEFDDTFEVLQNDIDLLNPPAELEKLKHKKKRLVQSPNSFFMDVKCQGCFNITTVFSHSQTVVVCPGCQTVLCQPTGGKARLTEGCSFRRKGD